MADIQHKNIPDNELHEMKGAAGASAGQIPVADGAGSTNFTDNVVPGAATATSGQIPIATGLGTAPFTDPPYVRQGWWDYNDLDTQTNQIDLSPADTLIQLTNDGAGIATNTSFAYPPSTNIWNTSTDYFDFSNLSVGDTIDIRLDVVVETNTSNDTCEIFLEMDSDGTPFLIPMTNILEFDTTGDHSVVSFKGVYIGSEAVRTGRARFLARSNNAGTDITVNGWYVRVLANG